MYRLRKVSLVCGRTLSVFHDAANYVLALGILTALSLQASRAPARAAPRRFYSTEKPSHKQAVEKTAQLLQEAKERALKDENARLFYQLFPDYASRSHEAGVKELKEMFTAAVSAMEPVCFTPVY